MSERYPVAFTSGALALTFYCLAVKYPVMSTGVGKRSFLVVLLERLAKNRMLRNGVLIVSVGYILLSLYLSIHSLRAEMYSLVEPRTITRKQAELIQKRLSRNQDSVTTVKCDLYDQEACEYAGQLSSVIASANWKMTQPDNHVEQPPVPPIEGIAIWQYSETNPYSTNDPSRRHAIQLLDVLRSAGIEASFGFNPSHENRIYVCIGHRPLRIVDKDDLLHRLDRWFNHNPYP